MKQACGVTLVIPYLLPIKPAKFYIPSAEEAVVEAFRVSCERNLWHKGRHRNGSPNAYTISWPKDVRWPTFPTL